MTDCTLASILMKPKVFILNGPNLNRLGRREKVWYGEKTLTSLEADWKKEGESLGFHVECRQSNHEGTLIDWLQEAETKAVGVLLNAGGYSHTSIALRDCVASIQIPVVEVHWTPITRREIFRHYSHLTDVSSGMVSGFGALSYSLALVLLAHDRVESR